MFPRISCSTLDESIMLIETFPNVARNARIKMTISPFNHVYVAAHSLNSIGPTQLVHLIVVQHKINLIVYPLQGLYTFRTIVLKVLRKSPRLSYASFYFVCTPRTAFNCIGPISKSVSLKFLMRPLLSSVIPSSLYLRIRSSRCFSSIHTRPSA